MSAVSSSSSSSLSSLSSTSTSSPLPGTCIEWQNNISTVLFTSDEIARKVKELASVISEFYSDKLRSHDHVHLHSNSHSHSRSSNHHSSQSSLLCVGLLTGAFVFLSDLVRELTIPYQVDFMVVSSYGHDISSSGSVKLKKDMSIDPCYRHVLIKEDLIDTGTTLAWLKQHLSTKRCLSVRVCCLLDKKARRLSEVDVDFCGFRCPDEFVIGYGMDYADDYRCLPYIGILKPETYNKRNAKDTNGEMR